MRKVAILVGGGLGDCIWNYFHDDYNRKLLSIKAEEPDLHVTCYVHTNNSQACELFRYNPHVQDVVVEPYRQELPRSITPLPHVFDLSKYKDNPMPIYLGEDEQNILNQVISQGEYVVIHPFAGEDRRAFWKELPDFIEKITKKYNVVVIGGSFVREDDSREERFDHSFPRVLNLVNQASVRLCCGLVQNAKYFIGSHSCYQMAAWAYGIKSLCLVPEGLIGYLTPHISCPHNPQGGLSFNSNPYVTHLFLPGNKIMFLEQIPHIQRFLDEFFVE